MKIRFQEGYLSTLTSSPCISNLVQNVQLASKRLAPLCHSGGAMTIVTVSWQFALSLLLLCMALLTRVALCTESLEVHPSLTARLSRSRMETWQGSTREASNMQHELTQKVHAMASTRGRELHTRRSLLAVNRTAMSATEVNALLAFRNSVQTPFTSALANWTLANNSTYCSTWKGVFCGELGEVTAIDLPDLSLNGTVTRMIGDLAHLRYLNLSGNSLWGPIPSELGRCRSLSIIDLSYNSLEGEVLPELFNMSKLESLSLSFNSFDSPLPEVADHAACQSLTTLWISYTNVYGVIPSSLSRCQNLTYLLLHDNLLTGSIPTTLAELQNLQKLALNNNILTGYVPSQLGLLKELRLLALYGNKLSGNIPSSLGMLDQLQELFLHDNKLTGSIPSFLGNCSSLTDLYLGSTQPGNNNLTGTIPEEYGNLSNLVVLYLMFNKHLTGPVPGFLSRCLRLERLYLRGCSFTSIEPKIWSMKTLQILAMNGNKVAGELPSEVGNCTNLGWVDLQFNNLSGSIPEGLGNLNKLISVVLANNRLSGVLPYNLGGCVSLQALDVSNNNLTGDIPMSLGNLSRLIYLDLTGNNLTSSAAAISTLNQCSNLITLRLGENKIYGPLQLDFSKWTSLKHFSISNNKLTGGIPPSLGDSNSSLVVLDFSHNNLTGGFPAEVDSTHFSSLHVLEIGNNELDGGIPSWLGNLKSLQVLNLSHNKLGGSIPQNFGNLDGFKNDSNGNAIDSEAMFTFNQNMNLISLGRNFTLGYEYILTNTTISMDLSSNKFQGEIPHGIAELLGLKKLDLSNNKLEGEIWPGIQNLRVVETLYLSQNNLSGPIPPTSSSSLSRYNVSFNNLSGPIPSGNQFDSFKDISSYLPGNPGLCGAIIHRPCNITEESFGISDHMSIPGFGIGAGIGFFIVVLISRTWPPARLFLFGATNKRKATSAGHSGYGLYRPRFS